MPITNTKLCVIVPAKDEGLVIGETLKSLLDANVQPHDIYVIDDGSTDNTQAVAQSLGVRTLRNEKNIGKAASIVRLVDYWLLVQRYDFIALMDADTRVNNNYFDAVRNSFKNEKVVVVCGQPKSRQHNWLTAYRCLLYAISAFVYKGGQSNMGVISVSPGCASTYRSSIFSQLDWSSDTIVEDMDVTIQVHRKKLGKIIYNNDAVVHTQDPRTVRSYVRQIYRWDVGTWQVIKKYHMFTGFKKIDWEYKFLLGEGLIFSLVYVLLPLWLFLFFHFAILALLVDLTVNLCIATIIAVTQKRVDVVLYVPMYQILRLIDSVVFLYSFWNTVVKRKKISTWFAVDRYSQPSKQTALTN